VPSLDENRILERWAGGVRLLQARAIGCMRCSARCEQSLTVPRAHVCAQVAAQELAWGIKFSATATLDIEEMPNGIAAAQRDGCAPLRFRLYGRPAVRRAAVEYC
jgi:hypothetical protein